MVGWRGFLLRGGDVVLRGALGAGRGTIAGLLLVSCMRFKGLAIGLIGLMGALLPLSAGAVQWVKVGIAQDYSSQVYVDAESLKRQGNMVQFWVYIVRREPNEYGINGLKAFGEANCATEDYRTLRTIAYVNGEVREDVEGEMKLSAAPGTLAQAFVLAACQR